MAPAVCLNHCAGSAPYNVKDGLVYRATALPARADETSTSCNTLHAGRALAEETYTGTANAVILFERNTQTLVYAHHPDVSVNPTGLTKLLTSLIVLEEGNLGDVVTVKRSTLNSVSPGSVHVGSTAASTVSVCPNASTTS